LRRRSWLGVPRLATVLLIFACGEQPAGVAPSAAPASVTSSTEAPTATTAPGIGTVEGCPVTLAVPASSVPEAASKPILDGSSNPELTRAQLSMYGNEAIWVTIPRGGVSPMDVTLPTVRLLPGALSASARRLDGPASAAEFVIPDGYGPVGFQAFGILFPIGGCWEVTQRFTLWVEG